MGGYRRAAARREQKEREKLHVLAEDGNKAAMMKEIYNRGQDMGMMLATAIIFMSLNEMYGFSSLKSGKGKLDRLIEKIREESIKMEQEPTQFTVSYYLKMLEEKTGINISR